MANAYQGMVSRMFKGRTSTTLLALGASVLAVTAFAAFSFSQSNTSSNSLLQAQAACDQYGNNCTNDAPVATGTSIAMNSGTVATLGLQAFVSDANSNLDFNSYDLNPSVAGQQTTFAVAGKGTFTVATNGSSLLTFTRDVSFTSGSAAVIYNVKDLSSAVSNNATITVNVNVPDVAAPTVQNQNGSTTGLSPVTLNVLTGASDNVGGTGINVASVQVTGASNATFVVNPSGTVTVTPTCTAPCSATANFSVADNAGNRSAAGTITVTVNQPSSSDVAAPTVVADTATTALDTAITIPVSVNDADNAGGSGLKLDSIQILTSPAPTNGTFVPNSTGGVIFTPNSGFSGNAVASYRITDNAGNLSNVATITVTVSSSNDTDGDGVNNTVENAGPNNGDANSDGTLDSIQPMVATLGMYAVGDKYVSVALSNGQGANCNKISSAVVQSLGNLVISDGAYQYPYGLMKLDLPCTQVDVTIDWFANSTADVKYRKLVYTTPGITSTAQFTDYSASLSKITKFGNAVYRAQFTLRDGQVGDLTAADGRILDPSGIAITPASNSAAAPELQRTGLGGFGMVASVFLIIIAGLTTMGAATHAGHFRRIN